MLHNALKYQLARREHVYLTSMLLFHKRTPRFKAVVRLKVLPCRIVLIKARNVSNMTQPMEGTRDEICINIKQRSHNISKTMIKMFCISPNYVHAMKYLNLQNMKINNMPR